MGDIRKIYQRIISCNPENNKVDQLAAKGEHHKLTDDGCVESFYTDEKSPLCLRLLCSSRRQVCRSGVRADKLHKMPSTLWWQRQSDNGRLRKAYLPGTLKLLTTTGG